jgi:hypothetical protein
MHTRPRTLVSPGCLGVVLALACAPPARAVELRLQFGALERMLAEQVFTQEGRRYVRGDRAAKCNFAYLEKPRVQGEAGKLRIRARFTGRSALNMFGQCVGMGDAFDVVITARPAYKDGNIGLADVAVTSDGRTGFYIRRVCTAMAATLARDFRYPVAAEAKKVLEDPGPQSQYRRELRSFRVTDIQVTGEALILAIDFELTVK